MKTYRIDEVGNKSIIGAVAENRGGREFTPVHLGVLCKLGASHEIGGDKVVTLILIDDTEGAGGGACFAIGINTEGRDSDVLGGVDSCEELLGIAVCDLTKDILARETVDACANVSLEGDGVGIGSKPDADNRTGG